MLKPVIHSFGHVFWIILHLFPLQVRSWCGLQVSTQKRMERQKLIVLGFLTLQQQLPGAAQQQGVDRGGIATAAQGRGAAGLRQQHPVLLRRHELPAHIHFWRFLPASSGSHLHDLEQVVDDHVRAACAWLRGLQRAGRRPLPPAGFSVCVRSEELPLRHHRVFQEVPSPFFLSWFS